MNNKDVVGNILRYAVTGWYDGDIEAITQARKELVEWVRGKVKIVAQHYDDFENGYETGYNVALNDLISEIEGLEE